MTALMTIMTPFSVVLPRNLSFTNTRAVTFSNRGRPFLFDGLFFFFFLEINIYLYTASERTRAELVT